ncbi:hypothetical protein MBLNU457_1835t2 [Dothideomycetes sp. NU457]
MADHEGDVTMKDDDEATDDGHEQQFAEQIEDDLDEKYPNRPHNHSQTLPFSDLYLKLFNPLQENRKKPTGPITARKKQGPHGPRRNVQDDRRMIIDRFISRWRKEVGPDIYPALRLIVPEKDRDRAMYGLKEKTIGKLLVKVMKIDKNAEDAQNLLNWKLPGYKATTAMAGDFAGRCYEVLKKRPLHNKPGTLTIADVNEMLDRMSVAQKEDNQREIFEEFYTQMNPEELMWLIRMILRQMKVGATEKTFFDAWHPDAENLFNVSSSLRRVCWELSDPTIRLDSDNRGITIMQCFQPQLAAFQMRSMETMVARMNLTEDQPDFWIEEKLDGERMQLHMIEDAEVKGGMRFAFWSRKAKDYSYLYGTGFDDPDGSLTRHLRTAFHEGVQSIILDGEMITWDPVNKAQVAFGTLKTAALSEQRNPFTDGKRPVYKIFDCLYLNGQVLTNYTLRDRRNALEKSVRGVEERMEIHQYSIGRSAADIEPLLAKVVQDASEGLVIKNPKSMYRLNERNDDWIKVKPEYMSEFGEALDCVVIGGYYGSGHRGGRLSSFMCGLRLDKNQIDQGANPQKCFSFFKVGGGFSAEDYAAIRHRTGGKWIDWDSKKPPTDYIELGGGDRQYEKPDVWIKPEDSVVISVKAAQITGTDQFRMGRTLRFPRFRKLRNDKDWTQALSIQEFLSLKDKIEAEKEEKKFKIDDERKQKRAKRVKKREVVIAGTQGNVATFTGPQTKLFEGHTFYILTDCTKPKTSKAQLEQLIKSHGGQIVQTQRGRATVCIAEKNVVKVASIKKSNDRNIIKPSWILDCVHQAEKDSGRPAFILPFEPGHVYHAISEGFDSAVDEWGDSYARDVTAEQLAELLESMPKTEDTDETEDLLVEQLLAGTEELFSKSPGSLFNQLTVAIISGQEPSNGDHMEIDEKQADDADLSHIRRKLIFGGAKVLDDVDSKTTHVVFGGDRGRLTTIRKKISGYRRLPRLVTPAWVEDCWRQRTLLDEETYVP